MKRNRWLIILSMILLISHMGSESTWASDSKIKDSESATHGDEASSYQIVNTYKYKGYELVQFNLSVLSHYSYLLVSEKQALAIDPGRDIFSYVEYAKKNNLKIVGVILTHSHADFVAGHMEFLKKQNVMIYSSRTSGAEYPHESLKEGSVIKLGNARLKILETPGHTPDGISVLVASAGQENKPDLILTGDTLFIGSVGRPDLMGGKMSAYELASMMYNTWTQKLAKLPDNVSIFPAHGAGSLCGAHLSDSPTSTIGAEKKSNPYLQYKNKSEFVAAILDGLPDAPQYFKHNAAMNRKGPELVDWDKQVQFISPDKNMMEPAVYYTVDLRSSKEYAQSHIPNSVNIGLRGRLESWVGIMVPWEAKTLVVGSPNEIKEAIYRLYRVGYRAEAVTFSSWLQSSLPTKSNQLLKPQELYQKMKTNEGPAIVDVRLPSEWMGVRIGTVINLPLNKLETLTDKLDSNKPVVAVCNSAYRSTMALGIFERKGFKNITSLDGGGEAWIKAGLPVYGNGANKTVEQNPIKIPQRQISLPERISADDLRRMILDIPGSFDLIDVRSPMAFKDFSIPGSTNVDINDAITNPAYLTGVGPLIIVDRDGSIASAIGGILSQKTKRVIKVLYGGLDQYWNSTELRDTKKKPQFDSPKKQEELEPNNMENQAIPQVPTTKKKSAGC